MGNMIEVEHLHRSFGTKEAVIDISFQVKRGEIFGLLGPNGAGKTTTIRMLSGQIEPNGGKAVVAGSNIVKDRAQLKKQIGVVFEDQNLYERLTARMNLNFSCWLYGLSTGRVDEVLELVGLRDRAKEPVRNFSNGMKQRLMIARALLHRPEVLFLDEPSRGLDPIAARDIRRTVQQLSEEGTTILLTTHLMEEADQLCQRVAFIAKGRIVINNEPRVLKLAYGKRSLVVTLVEQRLGTVGLEEIDLKMDSSEDQAKLCGWLQQGQVKAIHSREATLEEVFIATAGMQPA